VSSLPLLPLLGWPPLVVCSVLGSMADCGKQGPVSCLKNCAVCWAACWAVSCCSPSMLLACQRLLLACGGTHMHTRVMLTSCPFLPPVAACAAMPSRLSSRSCLRRCCKQRGPRSTRGARRGSGLSRARAAKRAELPAGGSWAAAAAAAAAVGHSPWRPVTYSFALHFLCLLSVPVSILSKHTLSKSEPAISHSSQ
jgi:hypothetical protein